MITVPSEPSSFNTMPQEISATLEKGKNKEQNSDDAVVILTLTIIQLEIIDDTVYEKIMWHTSFRAVTLYANVKGKNKHDKFKTVCLQFGDLPGYAGKVTQTIRWLTYMIVFFDLEDAMMQAIATTFSLDDNYDYKYISFQKIH